MDKIIYIDHFSGPHSFWFIKTVCRVNVEFVKIPDLHLKNNWSSYE